MIELTEAIIIVYIKIFPHIYLCQTPSTIFTILMSLYSYSIKHAIVTLMTRYSHMSIVGLVSTVGS